VLWRNGSEGPWARSEHAETSRYIGGSITRSITRPRLCRWARAPTMSKQPSKSSGITLGLTSSIATGIVSSMSDTDKIRENRLRRAAQRQGLMLAKSRRRDPRASDYGTYMLVDAQTNTLIAWGLPPGYGMSLDDVEDALRGEQVEQ
jgi:hypothetical protein